MSNCFSCFTLYERRKVHNKKGECESGESGDSPDVGEKGPSLLPRIEKPLKVSIDTDFNKEVGDNNIQAQTFNFRELASATKNFRQETLLGEGGFGRVYKGHLHKIGKTVAVKQLDRNGMQGNKEFLVEVLMLSNLHHQNLVNLIGYCADGDQRLLVYEFMPLGSLEDHLLDLQPEDTPLNWHTRLKIALGAAKGLEYLHDTASPPIIYRDLKSSNILLDEEYNAKLSDFGLAKLGPLGEKTHVSSRVMGTYGYCAPEYQRTGHLTLKSDIYSFGVVLLEIITGRRAIDPTKPIDEQNLVSWAEPYFREPSKFPLLADPLLQENYPVKSLNQIVAIAAMCLQDEASVRPLISDVVTALSFLGMAPDQGPRPPHPTPLPEPAPTPYSTKPPEPILDLDRPQLAPVLIPPQPAPPPTYDVVPIGQGSPIVQLSASPRAPSPPLSPVLSSTLAPVSPPAHVQNSPKASSSDLVLAPVLAPISPIAQVQDSPQAPSMVLDKASSPQFPSSPQSPSLVLSKALSMVQFPSSPQASSPIMDQALASPLDDVSASPHAHRLALDSPLAMDPGPMIDVHKGTYTMGSDSSDDDGDKYDSESDDNILGLTSEDEDCEEEVENAVEWAPTSRNEQQRFLVTTDA